MRPSKLVTAALVGYLVGTFPSADLAAQRVSGGAIDLRQAGSGNPGGMNARRLLGRRAGTAVITADVAKGATAGLVGRLVAGRTGSHVAATAAVVGHCYPIWRGFRGGKGVATSAGQCLATFPASVPITAAGAALTASAGGERRAINDDGRLVSGVDRRRVRVVAEALAESVGATGHRRAPDRRAGVERGRAREVRRPAGRCTGRLRS